MDRCKTNYCKHINLSGKKEKFRNCRQDFPEHKIVDLYSRRPLKTNHAKDTTYCHTNLNRCFKDKNSLDSIDTTEVIHLKKKKKSFY